MNQRNIVYEYPNLNEINELKVAFMLKNSITEDVLIIHFFHVVIHEQTLITFVKIKNLCLIALIY